MGLAYGSIRRPIRAKQRNSQESCSSWRNGQYMHILLQKWSTICPYRMGASLLFRASVGGEMMLSGPVKERLSS